MNTNGFMAHDSSDGTSFPERLSRFYSGGNIAENVATTSGGSTYAAVFHQWMCSTKGHRGAIMGDYTHLGPGVSGKYMTQDFAGESGTEHRGLGFGAHESNGGATTFLVDVYDGDKRAPDEVIVVLNGIQHPMTLRHGQDWRGIYEAGLQAGATGCQEYFFQASWGERVVRFPETGSYGWADCDWDDADAQWLNNQMRITGREDLSKDELKDMIQRRGCSSLPGQGLGWLGLLAGIAGFGLRRRRAARG